MGDLKAEAESEIKSVKSGARNKKKKTQRANANYVSHLRRIISACPILAKEQYKKRHDRLCAQLYFNDAKKA